MKKILKEWKKWIMETKPTEKYFGQYSKEKTNSHDRAVPDTQRQKDFRSTFKEYLGQFLVSNRGMGNMEELVSEMTDEEKMAATRDLNIMKYIYSGHSQYDIYDSDNVKSGIIYNNQPAIVGSPVEKIDAVLNDIGMPFTQVIPSDQDMEEIYIYYIKPNYHAALEPEQPKSNRFASQLSWSADKLAKMNKDVWLKNKIKNSKRKK